MWLRQLEGDLVPGGQTVVFPGGAAVFRDPALFQQVLGGAAAQLCSPGQEGVQPLPFQIGVEGHDFFSSFQKALLQKIRWKNSTMQPQVMKQSATLNTGKSINVVSIMSTT